MIATMLVLLSSAAVGHCPPASEGQVRTEFARWMKAYEAHDLAGTMAIFGPEVLFQFQGAPDAGWKELEASYARGFAKPGQRRWTPQWDQIVVSGKVAAAFSKWVGTITDTSGKLQVFAENRGVDVLKRGPDCRWRIIRSLTYPMSRPAPPATK